MRKMILAAAAALLSLGMAAQPKVVSHRGFYVTGDSFENTISSLANAQRLGVYGVEFDVNLTSDDKIVILHGPKIHGTDIVAQKSTLAKVRSVTLPGGHKVPTLDEWLDQGAKDPGTKLIMELKKHNTPERETLLAEMVVAEVKRRGMMGQVEFISFSEHAIDEVLRIAPEAYTCYVSSDQRAMTPAEAAQRGYKGLSYNLNVFMNFPEMVDQARELGIDTTLWMVEDSEVVDWAFRHGITYVSTDFPDKTKAYIDAVGAFKAKDTETFKKR